VILGDGAVVESYRYLDASAGTPSSIIEASEQVDTEDWLRRHPADLGEAPRGDYVVPAGGAGTSTSCVAVTLVAS